MAKKLEFHEGEEAQKRFDTGMKKLLAHKPAPKAKKTVSAAR